MAEFFVSAGGRLHQCFRRHCFSGTGGYSNAEKTIIYFVVNRFQIYKMRSIIHAIDPRAFVTISEVADVFKSND